MSKIQMMAILLKRPLVLSPRYWGLFMSTRKGKSEIGRNKATTVEPARASLSGSIPISPIATATSRKMINTRLKRAASTGFLSSPHSQPKPWAMLYETPSTTSRAAPRQVANSATTESRRIFNPVEGSAPGHRKDENRCQRKEDAPGDTCHQRECDGDTSNLRR